MDGVTFISRDQVTDEHIRQALLLDRMSYDDVFFLEISTCIAYHAKNDLIYVMAVEEHQKRVVGYVNLSPITKQAYEMMRSGKVIDTVLRAEDIETYEDGRHYYGYLSSIVVHPEFRRQLIAHDMLRITMELLTELATERGIFFDFMIADAVSDAGQCLLTKLGFRELFDSAHGTHIMEWDVFDKKAIPTEYNEKLLDTYRRSL